MWHRGSGAPRLRGGLGQGCGCMALPHAPEGAARRQQTQPPSPQGALRGRSHFGPRSLVEGRRVVLGMPLGECTLSSVCLRSREAAYGCRLSLNWRAGGGVWVGRGASPRLGAPLALPARVLGRGANVGSAGSASDHMQLVSGPPANRPSGSPAGLSPGEGRPWSWVASGPAKGQMPAVPGLLGPGSVPGGCLLAPPCHYP